MPEITENGAFVIGCNELDGSVSQLQLSQADAAVLDVGYVLESDGEMVQVVGINWTDIYLARGYGRTNTVAHAAGASWHIVNWPTYAPTPLPERALRDCANCGAPAQLVGEPCVYCKAIAAPRDAR